MTKLSLCFLRQMTVTMGNQLVECQECHNLYHQDCHKPQVTDKEVNDPRLVWYCARCTRQMKRMVREIELCFSACCASALIVTDQYAVTLTGPGVVCVRLSTRPRNLSRNRRLRRRRQRPLWKTHWWKRRSSNSKLKQQAPSKPSKEQK